MAASRTSLARALSDTVGTDVVLEHVPSDYLVDATVTRGVRGRADAVALPRDVAEVARLVAWCYEHDVPITTRGGGSGFSGGAVPDGGLVLALERLARVRSLVPELWRVEVEAGVRTGTVHRLARESGLVFPPDPGAWEQSQIGGNVATNAGGPHAFKYGVTGAWVTGLEAVVAPGEIVRVGGPTRKDVAGYDVRGLLIGSEGTLGVITAAWLRLLPAPEVALPVAATYPDVGRGVSAVASVLASGAVPAALEYLDAGALAAARASFPQPLAPGAAFLVIAEADGARGEALRVQAELREALGPGSLDIYAPAEPADVRRLWRWRDGVSLAVSARRGGKVSEDIVVPVERLAEAIEHTASIGARHGLEACSWGHAGDGNLHGTFELDPGDPDELARADLAAEALFELALALGGSISGEHGVGLVKRAHAAAQWTPAVLALQRAIKQGFDPKGLLNPGKKLPEQARAQPPDATAAVAPSSSSPALATSSGAISRHSSPYGHASR